MVLVPSGTSPSSEVQDLDLMESVLRPFDHQVGGHTVICKINERTICKPLIPTERDFYESSLAHKALVAFIPNYLGVINVANMASPVRESIEARAGASAPTSGQADASGDMIVPIAADTPAPVAHEDAGDDAQQHGLQRGERLVRTSSQVPAQNPWNLYCARRDEGKHVSHQYVLLEDLTFGLRCPCILDLKMGTRQHGVNALPAKRARQIAKCQSTTSAQLGLRVCGMQVYREASGSYYYQDKYYGRRLRVEQFKRNIALFLHNGRRLLAGFIPSFIQRLTQLYRVIESLPQYRFYGSSLLLIYEGHPDADYVRDIDLRMIDFAHAHVSEESSEPDRGYLLGLRNLINTFEEILRDGEASLAVPEAPSGTAAAQSDA